MASRSGSPRLWLLAGVLVGLAVLTRTNGITLLAVALLPWLRREHRLRNGGLIVAGIVASLGLWVVYAAVTGSKLGPEGSHVSLAYHFYHRDLLFDDASVLLVGEFGSVVDVVLHDPMRIVVLYVRGLYNVFHELLAADFLLDSPINLLVLPGLVYLLATSSRELYGYLLLLVVPQILLLNLAIADQRYYLFLVPLFGASAIATVAMLVAAVGRPAWRTAIVAGFVGCVLVAAGSSAREAGRLWSANVVELEQAIAAVRSAAGESTLVVARKEHIAYYTGLPHRWLPASLSELQSDLASAGRDDVLIYIGSEEIKLRPGIEALAAAEDLPDWLVPVTGGQTPVPWRLLRYAGASASADRSADTR
jgi:4-amino-4-deoxy-L-arabinose transferase-like glycosyltransferase